MLTSTFGILGLFGLLFLLALLPILAAGALYWAAFRDGDRFVRDTCRALARRQNLAQPKPIVGQQGGRPAIRVRHA